MSCSDCAKFKDALDQAEREDERMLARLNLQSQKMADCEKEHQHAIAQLVEAVRKMKALEKDRDFWRAAAEMNGETVSQMIDVVEAARAVVTWPPTGLPEALKRLQEALSRVGYTEGGKDGVNDGGK